MNGRVWFPQANYGDGQRDEEDSDPRGFGSPASFNIGSVDKSISSDSPPSKSQLIDSSNSLSSLSSVAEWINDEEEELDESRNELASSTISDDEDSDGVQGNTQHNSSIAPCFKH